MNTQERNQTVSFKILNPKYIYIYKYLSIHKDYFAVVTWVCTGCSEA